MEIIESHEDIVIVRSGTGHDIIIFEDSERRLDVAIQVANDEHECYKKQFFHNNKEFSRYTYTPIDNFDLDPDLARMMERLGYDEDDEHLDT